MDKHFNKRDNEVEYEPQINHFNVRSHRQGGGDVDEHGGQDQHHGQVHRHNSLEYQTIEPYLLSTSFLKEKVFEVVCCMSDDVQQDSWKEGGEKCCC